MSALLPSPIRGLPALAAGCHRCATQGTAARWLPRREGAALGPRTRRSRLRLPTPSRPGKPSIFPGARFAAGCFPAMSSADGGRMDGGRKETQGSTGGDPGRQLPCIT